MKLALIIYFVPYNFIMQKEPCKNRTTNEYNFKCNILHAYTPDIPFKTTHYFSSPREKYPYNISINVELYERVLLSLTHIVYNNNVCIVVILEQFKFYYLIQNLQFTKQKITTLSALSARSKAKPVKQNFSCSTVYLNRDFVSAQLLYITSQMILFPMTASLLKVPVMHSASASVSYIVAKLNSFKKTQI